MPPLPGEHRTQDASLGNHAAGDGDPEEGRPKRHDADGLVKAPERMGKGIARKVYGGRSRFNLRR
jgi:hypothetical protein